MSKQPEKHDRLRQLVSWVDGDREPKDQTLFVMEQRPHRDFRPSEEEFERREKDRLRKFFNWYPIAAAVISAVLGLILLATVMNMPGFGQEDNPINNEVSQRYLEQGAEETGSENVVTAMIIGYRGFDTLGESCVLFLAVAAVMILLLRDRKNTSEHEARQMEREEESVQEHADLILKQVAWVLIPFIFLFAIYVLLNGETSPGGGFSGGTILGAGLILNVWLKLDIWDYSRLPGNLWGQVCLKYALLWVVLAGTAIVLFDWMRHWLFHEERPHYRWI